MKILVLTSTFPRWTNDTEPGFVDLLCQNLAEGNTIDVVAPHFRGAATQEILGDVTVYRFRYWFAAWQTLAYDGGILPNLRQKPLRVLLVPTFLLSQWLMVLQLLRRNRYDIIHAHWIIPQGFVAAVARAVSRTRTPIALTSHGGDLFALKGVLLARLKRWIARQANALTVVSSTMKEQAVAMELQDEARISTIPMGVNTRDTFLPPDPETKRKGLLFVGRLVDKKGVEYLLSAMPKVLDRFPDEHLTIIGDGPLRQPLEGLCRQLGISQQVSFKGSLANADIPPFLQRAAIAIFPSVITSAGDQEGSPVAIMEALACGCAVIVADYPGARDLVIHGTSGLIVAGRDSAAIADAALALLDNEALLAMLGKKGRQWVQDRYDWTVISKQFMHLFEQLTSGQPR